MELSRNRHIAGTLITITLIAFAVANPRASDETAPPPSYVFATIDLPNAKGVVGSTTLIDIDERGNVIGGFADSSGPSFLLSKDFTVTNIDCLGSTTTASGFGKGINRHGAIAGFCGQGGRIHGFLRRKNGEVTLLDFPGANLTEAAGINDFDQIVGDYRDSGGRFHGFFWDNGLFLTFDVPFPGTRSSALIGINNVGQIIGSYFDGNVSAQFPNGHPHAFLYDDEGFASIDFPGAISTGVSAMNDSGTIVGFYTSNDPIGHPYVLEHGSFTTFVLPFPNVTLTDLTGINNRGQLVGRYIERAPSFPNQIFNRGFVATPQRQENATQEENIVSSLGSQ